MHSRRLLVRTTMQVSLISRTRSGQRPISVPWSTHDAWRSMLRYLIMRATRSRMSLPRLLLRRASSSGEIRVSLLSLAMALRSVPRCCPMQFVWVCHHQHEVLYVLPRRHSRLKSSRIWPTSSHSTSRSSW